MILIRRSAAASTATTAHRHRREPAARPVTRPGTVLVASSASVWVSAGITAWALKFAPMVRPTVTARLPEFCV